MGRKGELLRAAKKQKAVYTFTGEELEKHDREVIKAFWKQTETLAREADKKREEEFRKKANEIWKQTETLAREADKKREEEFRKKANEIWDERAAQFQDNDRDGNMLSCMKCFFAISCRVLIEQFGWKPPRVRGRNTRIMRFADALTEEISRITRDEAQDIVAYSEETYEKYGVGFRIEEGESA